jgi:hypothetical protein
VFNLSANLTHVGVSSNAPFLINCRNYLWNIR